MRSAIQDDDDDDDGRGGGDGGGSNVPPLGSPGRGGGGGAHHARGRQQAGAPTGGKRGPSVPEAVMQAGAEWTGAPDAGGETVYKVW